MQIGRKIYYDLATGNAIQDTGERQGSVYVTTIQEDFTDYHSLHGRSLIDTSFLELSYGERFAEFLYFGSYHVDVSTRELTIFPHFTFTQDKSTILADGVDTATITVQTAGNEIALFIVDDVEYPRTPIDGVCTFSIDSDLPGTIDVTITSVKYGQAVVMIEVI